MASTSTDVLSHLLEALRCLPGVGPKSAQRIAFSLLQQHQRTNGLRLAACLEEAMRTIGNCLSCNNYTTSKLCHLCTDESRDRSLLCIVERPTDLIAIEQTRTYIGYYYVLMNKISPLDGVGPEEIGLPKLQNRVLQDGIKEIIIALSPTIEGQTTSHFIRELWQEDQIRITQLAQGIPWGAELEFLDSQTIGSALRDRT